MAETDPHPEPIRIGAVNYLNSKPLVSGLEKRVAASRVLFDLPSRLADSLAAGRLDVALIPVVESFGHADYRVVSDACVASNGPVRSVKLYFRRPPAEVRRLALDEGSRTSAALSRVLLDRRHGVRPTLESLPIGAGVEATDADAVLLIGDRAMLPPAEAFVEAWDLATEWRAWTGLPFVFACWVARRPMPARLAKALAATRDEGLRRVAAIAADEGPKLDLPAGLAEEYLTLNLHFQIGPAERESLRRFRDECVRLGLVTRPATTAGGSSLAQ